MGVTVMVSGRFGDTGGGRDVSKRAGRQQESRQRERERRRARDQRRQDRAIDAGQTAASAGLAVPVTAAPPTDSDVDVDLAVEVLASGRRVAGQQVACGWCGEPITLRRTGRMPKWCSAGCRQRAWEQGRAAASGQAAVRVVDRYVAAVPADGPGWISLLGVLADRVANEHGRIADRDLDELAAALELVHGAVANRAGSRGRSDRD